MFAIVVAAVVFVEIVQPLAFDLAGLVVNFVGGSVLAATVVVWGLYLAVAASAWTWWRLEQEHGLGRRTVTLGVLAAPLWLAAIAITPPSRNVEESARLISGYVGDASLGAKIDQAVTTGLVMVLVVGGLRWLVRRTVLRDRRP